MQYAALNEALNNPVILTNHHPIVLSGTPGPRHHFPPAPRSGAWLGLSQEQVGGAATLGVWQRQSLLNTNGILLIMALFLWILLK